MNDPDRLTRMITLRAERIRTLKAEIRKLRLQQYRNLTQRHPKNSSEAFDLAVGMRIRAARRNMGLTQQELAQAAGLSRGSIANIERGDQSPPLYRLTRIAAALNVTTASLMEPGEAE